MKKITCLFIVLISFCLSAQQKHKIAILDYEDRSETIEAEMLSAATDYLRMYLEGQNGFAVIPKDQQNESASSCTDKLCRIKFGETLGAEIVAYPYITSANEQYAINVEIINVAKRSSTISVSESWNGEIDSLDPLSETIVRKIAAKQKNIDALNANNSFRENIPQEEPTFAETFKVAYNTVRDTQACEKARKKENIKEWNDYLKTFPEGQCIEEAKKFIEEYPKKQDAEACEKARKKDSLRDWEKYLKQYPDGQCAEEAKTFTAEYDKKQDAEACESAREKRSLSGWERYLRKFPNGQCAEEAKAAPDNFACAEAEKEDSLKSWKEYLDEYPNGRCAAQARENFSNRENIEQMMKKGRDMKIAGATLFTIGTVGFIVGMSVGGSYESKGDKCHSYYESGPGWWGSGTICDYSNSEKAFLSYIIGGTIGGALLVTGLPVMIVGVLKEKRAKSYLEINNLAVIPQKDGFYATIGFNF